MLEPLDPNNKEAVLDLVGELVKAGEECSRKYKLVADRNERYVSGEQYEDINPMSWVMEDTWNKALPRVTQNHLRNLINTWKARITKDRPSVTAWPTSSAPEAQASANIARQLIEYFEKEMQIDLLIDDCVRLGGMHSIAGFKVCYNPLSEKVEWQRVSIEDFYIDPTKETFDDANWVIFRAYIDKYEAKAELEAAGIDEMPPSTMYKVNCSEDREGVEVLELWHKPTARVKGGLFCKVIGNNVIDNRPYPYLFSSLENPEGQQKEAVLPLVYFKVDYKRGTPYADTWLSDAIPAQRQINETEGSLLEIRRKFANVKMVVPDSATMESMRGGNQIIVSKDGPASVGYAQPAQVPSILFADREYHFSRLYDIAGLNEQLVGVTNVKSGTSARQIAYLSELDSMKHKGTSQSIETMLVRAWKLTLQLVQYYYVDERLMRISHKSGFDTVAFRGADIQGITVDLAPRTGMDRFAATKAAQVEEDAQAGWVPPQQAIEARSTGQTDSIVDNITRTTIQRDVQALLQGATPAVDPGIDQAIALDEIKRIRQLLANEQAPAQLLAMLDQFAAQYQAASAPAPMPQPGPPNPGQQIAQ